LVIIASLVGGAACGLTGRPAVAAGPDVPLAPPPVEPIAAERRAVRGAPLGDAVESPELRDVRRFEEMAFPRTGEAPLPIEQSTDDRALPPGLRGRWAGSGDFPDELRSPALRRGPERTASMPDSDWLRSLKLPDLPVRWEPPVLRFLEYFTRDTKGRAIMSAFLRRMGRFEALITRVLERKAMPKDIIYLAMIESGFEPKALSSKSAGGLWQFMPGVARAYGLEVSYWVDARRDPERAVEAAAHYLEDLYARFGSWHLAFAAYHAGYGAILSSITRYNTNDYWELCKHEAGLPWETTLYVPKILAAAIIGRNREAFGFGDIVPDLPFAYDRVEARPGTTLAAVARAVNTPLEVVQTLNPELLRDRTPPDRGPSPLRVPPGTSALYAQAIEGARATADRVDTFVMRFGESLDDVAKQHGLSVRELRRLNGLRDLAELRGGTTIVVPAQALASDPRAAADPAAEPLLVAVPEKTWRYDDREQVFYRTREGDTLEELATVFQVNEDDLAEWNALDPTAKLHPRMILQVFVRKGFDRAGVVLLDPTRLRVVTLGTEEFHALETARRGKTRLYYTAREGDTLAKIARRYGLYAGDLARINRLSYSSELKPGQQVVVYSPSPDLPREVTLGRSQPQKRPATVPGPPAKAAAAPTAKPAAPPPSAKPGPAGGGSKPTGASPPSSAARTATKPAASRPPAPASPPAAARR
jgi:membrane-bound lytic murein transglycosylase D